MRQHYWGKTNHTPEGSLFLTIWEHSLYATAITDAWLTARPVLLKQWQQLCSPANGPLLPSETARDIARHFICLHDLGKYLSLFQRKQIAVWQQINPTLTTPLPTELKSSFDHGKYGLACYGLLVGEEGEEEEAGTILPSSVPWRDYMQAVAIHHGHYFADHHSHCKSYRFGDALADMPIDLTTSLMAMRCHLQKTIALFPIPKKPANKKTTAATAAFLSGLCSVADWIGSHDGPGFFEQRPVGLSANLPETLDKPLKEKAHTILQKLHLTGTYRGTAANRISRIFPDIPPTELQLKTIQKQATTLPLSDNPQLLIIEAPMGVGKTEAALLLADRLLAAGCVDKLYFALPTMATANAMYGRLQLILAGDHFFDAHASLVLAHGQRDIEQAFNRNLLGLVRYDTTPKEDDRFSPSAVKMCNRFFTQGSKRSLLATAGTGTIDQAMAATLPTPHHWVKLFALAGTVVIFDEIHSYDAYMQTIIKKTLQWIRALGGHVILLSATLASGTKAALIDGWGTPQTTIPAHYPLITRIGPNPQTKSQENRIDHFPCHEESATRVVGFQLLRDPSGQLENILNTIIKQCDASAQVCLLVNTVNKAQDLYQAWQKQLADKDIDVFLFHSRFRPLDRSKIEKKVVNLFGKDSTATRWKGRLLIATQVVEQSLDVDFDFMVSEIAPFDLLLQRVGRVHRHRINDALRQGKNWENPKLFVFSPAKDAETWLAEKPATFSVYDDAIIYRTERLFETAGTETRFKMRLPDEMRDKIEQVYTDDLAAAPAEHQPRLAKKTAAWQKLKNTQHQAGIYSVICGPNTAAQKLNTSMVKQENPAENELVEPHPEAGGTRLAAPSVELIFVDPTWFKSLTGNRSDNESYRNFTRRLRENSLSIPRSLLRINGSELTSEALQVDAYPDLDGWENYLKRFQKEYRYSTPLILPLPKLVEGIYRFRDTKATITYSETIGVSIKIVK